MAALGAGQWDGTMLLSPGFFRWRATHVICPIELGIGVVICARARPKGLARWLCVHSWSHDYC